jgi:hypothetical protein
LYVFSFYFEKGKNYDALTKDMIIPTGKFLKREKFTTTFNKDTGRFTFPQSNSRTGYTNLTILSDVEDIYSASLELGNWTIDKVYPKLKEIKIYDMCPYRKEIRIIKINYRLYSPSHNNHILYYEC